MPPCDPVLFVMGVGTALNTFQQMKQANTQHRMARTQQDIVSEQVRRDQSSLRHRQAQERLAEAQEQDDAARRVQEARAAARVSAAQAGVEGQTIDDIVADMSRQGAEFRARRSRTLSGLEEQIDVQADAVGTQGFLQMLALQPTNPGPGVMDLVVGLGMNVASREATLQSQDKSLFS